MLPQQPPLVNILPYRSQAAGPGFISAQISAHVNVYISASSPRTFGNQQRQIVPSLKRRILQSKAEIYNIPYVSLIKTHRERRKFTLSWKQTMAEPGCYTCCSGKVTHRALRTSDLHQDLKASFWEAFNIFFTLRKTNIYLSGLLL